MNGVVEETRLAAAVLKHLTNKIAPHGSPLNAGDVVLAGSFTRPTNAARGDTLPVDGGLLSSISFRFV